MLGLPDSAFAQKKVNPFGIRHDSTHVHPNRFWVDISAGLGLTDNPTLFATFGGANLHFMDKKYRHYQLRYNLGLVESIFGRSKVAEVSDIGYLWGFMLPRRYFMMEAAVGLSIVAGQKRYSQAYNAGLSQFVTAGLPAELDIKLMFRRYFGIGLSVKGNLNPETSYLSVGLELTFNGPN